MKKVFGTLTIVMLMLTPAISNATTANITKVQVLGDPIVSEIQTAYKTVKEALMATQNALKAQSFVSGTMATTGFTATRTESKTESYTAVVSAVMVGSGAKVTIKYATIGEGRLDLTKLSGDVRNVLVPTK